MLGKELQQAAGNAGEATYIDDVFSTWLYTGNGTSQTITNGIDLATEGGMVWTKDRSSTSNNLIFDTTSGLKKWLRTNDTSAYIASGVYGPTAFLSNGYTVEDWAGNIGFTSPSSDNFVSWTFRKAPKFFDIVTWTGNGANYRALNHSLGSTPGMVIVKSTSASGNWAVWHRSTDPNNLILNSTSAAISGQYSIQDVTSTVFAVANSSFYGFPQSIPVNDNGATYVAYLFAHNAGGFGDTGSDNVISCGSYTGTGSGEGPQVNLGYEPQWLLIKNVTGGASMDWWLFDSMRGMAVFGAIDADLRPNLTQAEERAVSYVNPNATGFTTGAATALNQVQTYIYIAIRRPMKPPSAGTGVFGTKLRTGDNASSPTNIVPTTALTTDMTLTMNRSGGVGGAYSQGAVGGFVTFDRLRGDYRALYTISSNAEPSPGPVGFRFDTMNGVNGVGLDSGQFFNYDTNNPSYSYINYFFKRAPGFFDVVCYTGAGTVGYRAIPHNLTVTPELIIVKKRSSATGGWVVGTSYVASGFAGNNYLLNSSAATFGSGYLGGGAGSNPTATNFYVEAFGNTNDTDTSGVTYVAYLFASLPGISKVGSYTGNGTNQTINCGFTTGARFVLIKRTDSTGDWYVWDTARGIVSANDPHLSLNTSAAEVTTDDSVDPVSSGFIVNQVAATNVNVSSATYIFLAIA